MFRRTRKHYERERRGEGESREIDEEQVNNPSVTCLDMRQFFMSQHGPVMGGEATYTPTEEVNYEGIVCSLVCPRVCVREKERKSN